MSRTLCLFSNSMFVSDFCHIGQNSSKLMSERSFTFVRHLSLPKCFSAQKCTSFLEPSLDSEYFCQQTTGAGECFAACETTSISGLSRPQRSATVPKAWFIVAPSGRNVNLGLNQFRSHHPSKIFFFSKQTLAFFTTHDPFSQDHWPCTRNKSDSLTSGQKMVVLKHLENQLLDHLSDSTLNSLFPLIMTSLAYFQPPAGSQNSFVRGSSVHIWPAPFFRLFGPGTNLPSCGHLSHRMVRKIRSIWHCGCATSLFDVKFGPFGTAGARRHDSNNIKNCQFIDLGIWLI